MLRILKKMFLICFLLCNFLFYYENFANEVCDDCISFQVSSPDGVLWTGWDVPMHVPDSQFSVIKFSDHYKGFVSGYGGSYMLSASNILGLNQSNFSPIKVIDRGTWIGSFDECGAWIFHVEVEDGTNNVFTWYHAEWSDWSGKSRCSEQAGTWKHIRSIAYAKSVDWGKTFSKVNYPNNIVLKWTPEELAAANDNNNPGVGDFNIVKSWQYYYLFYVNQSKRYSSVARATISSWWVPGSWYKLYNGEFSEPWIWWKDSALPLWIFEWVSYNTKLWKFVAIIHPKGSSYNYIKIALSPNATDWTVIDTTLLADGNNFADNPMAATSSGWKTPHGFSAYHNIIAPDGSKNWSDKAYFYYLYIRPWDDFTKRFFLRREIKMKINSLPISTNKTITNLARYYSSSAQKHWVTTELAIPQSWTWDFKKEGDLWGVFTLEGNNLTQLNDCVYDKNHYVVVAGNDCSPWQTKLRTIWWIYSPNIEQPKNTSPIYRCYIPTTQSHFVSIDSQCGWWTGITVEGKLWYTVNIWDTTSPETTLNTKPTNQTIDKNATFTFSSNEQGTYICKLDSWNYEACTSPKTYTNLSVWNHTFIVKAIDNAWNEDATPETYTWLINNHIEIISYTVTYNWNWWVWHTPTTKSITNNTKIWVLPSNPTREWYTFKWWYTSATWWTQINSSTIITKNIIYYAQWNIVPTPTPDPTPDPIPDPTPAPTPTPTPDDNWWSSSNWGSSNWNSSITITPTINSCSKFPKKICWVKYIKSCNSDNTTNCKELPVYKTFTTECELKNNTWRYKYYKDGDCEEVSKIDTNLSIENKQKLDIVINKLIKKISLKYKNKSDKIKYTKQIIKRLEELKLNNKFNSKKEIIQYIIDKLNKYIE